MLSKGETRLIHALKSRSGREKHGAFAVEGVRLAEDLLAAPIDLKFAVVAPSAEDTLRGAAIVAALAERTRVERVPDSELGPLADTETPQGLLVVAAIPEHDLSSIRVDASALVLLLDGVQDPGNLGTLIRSAEAFAANAVIALPGTVDFWNPKVVRSTAGAAFRVPLVAPTAEQTWSWLAERDFEICGADMHGTAVQLVRQAARPGSHRALVVGNEGSGLRSETRARVTTSIAIPMRGRAESLNVAVAAGILLYELSQEN